MPSADQESGEWMERAESDLKHAEFSMGNDESHWAQFAAQQAAEKALKAHCLKKGLGLLKAHELAFLAKKIGAPGPIVEKCAMLSPFYTSARYPDADIAQNESAKKKAAQEAIDAAREVISWCKKGI